LARGRPTPPRLHKVPLQSHQAEPVVEESGSLYQCWLLLLAARSEAATVAKRGAMVGAWER